jgi:hypothetical protein
VRRDLTVDLGLRLDAAILPDSVPFNALFFSTYGLRNDRTYDGDKILQPRLGFNWQPEGRRRTTVRGGVGLFYGRMPRVWLSNSYSNTGLNYASYLLGRHAAALRDPANQPTVGTAPAQTVAFLDEGFRLPSRWKSNLAFERELPFLDLKFTAEAEYSWVDSDVFYENINIRQTSTGPDGRVLYFKNAAAVLADSQGAMTYVKPGSTAVVASGTDKNTLSPGTQLVSTAFTSRIVKLTNTDEGRTAVATVSIERPRKADGWSWKASYVRTDAHEALCACSSVAASNWSYRSVFNPNEPVVHTAELEIRDRILVNLTKDFALFGKNRTTVSLVYDGHSGLPFSLTYAGRRQWRRPVRQRPALRPQARRLLRRALRHRGRRGGVLPDRRPFRAGRGLRREGDRPAVSVGQPVRPQLQAGHPAAGLAPQARARLRHPQRGQSAQQQVGRDPRQQPVRRQERGRGHGKL